MKTNHSQGNRQLAAILFADIAGYTALMQKDEAAASALLLHFQKEIEEKVAGHNGRIVNFYGDGALCIFNNPLEAVHCAMQLQSSFQDDSNIQVPVRIGLHSGTVVFENEKIFGNSVNLASRIESMGVPGAVLFSKTIRNEIKNQPELKMKPLGHFAFKNVEEEMEVFALANEGFVVPETEKITGKFQTKPNRDATSRPLNWLWPIVVLIVLGIGYFISQGNNNEKEQSFDKKSIAVLPLINLNPKDENLAYFSDGVTQEIIDELAKIRSFSVTAFTTSFLYKHNTKPHHEIAEELDVSYIVSGTSRIYESGDSVVLSIELIDPESQKRIWSGRYHEVMKNAPTLQLSIAKQIAESLNIDLTKEERLSLNKVNTHSGEAFQLFLKAKGEMANLSVEGLDRGEKYLIEAIEIDSNYAQAYTLLAWNYVVQGWSWYWRGHIPVAEGRQKALENINKAIALNPESSDIYLVRGNFNVTFDGNIEQGLKDVERALKLNSWPDVPTNYCVCTAVTINVMAGKLKKAKELATLANKIDPGNIFIFIDQGVIYMQEGKMLQSQAMFKKAVDVMDIPIFNYLMGWSYFHNNQLEASIPHFENARLTDSTDIAIHIAYLSNVHFLLNQKDLSKKYRTEVLIRLGNGEETMNMPMAILAAIQGTKEETLQYLEKAFEAKEPNMSYLMNVDPLFRPLHDEPRFRSIREKMGYYE